jgi:hypothetical protein
MSPRRLPALLTALSLLPLPAFAALANPPREDVHFRAEHLPEAAQDARYLTLPWLAGRLEPGRWKATLQAGSARSEFSFLKIQGPMAAISAGTGLTQRWGIEGMAFYDAMTIAGGTGTELLRAGFLRGVPLDLPEQAEFSNPRGDYRHWGAGGALVREVSPPGSAKRWTWKLGLLYDRLEVKDYQMDYRLLGGADAGARGVLDHSSQADYLTPFVGIQRTLPLGGAWALAPRFVAGAPLPAGDYDGRLTGPGFDLSTARGDGKPGRIGDGFAGLSAGLLHLRSGLEIDLGGTLFFPLLEKASHPGANKALLLQIAWHF